MHPDQNARFFGPEHNPHSQRQAPVSMRSNINKLHELYGELDLLLQQALPADGKRNV